MICKTVFFELERKSSKPSITKIGERLDFRVLLQRASAGIIDIRQFQIPRISDVSGADVGDPANSKSLDDLMSRESTVLDNLFGASVEDAEKELSHHQSVLARYQQERKDADADIKDKDKDEPPKDS